jgi:hypothetical protein
MAACTKRSKQSPGETAQAVLIAVPDDVLDELVDAELVEEIPTLPLRLVMRVWRLQGGGSGSHQQPAHAHPAGVTRCKVFYRR